MRDDIEQQGTVFSYIVLEARVHQLHAIRKSHRVVDKALTTLGPDFEQLYSDYGRTSIAPEKRLRARLLQILRSIRTERQLVEGID